MLKKFTDYLAFFIYIARGSEENMELLQRLWC